MLTALPLIFAIQAVTQSPTAPIVIPPQYEFELRRGDELCESVRRASLALQLHQRAAEETAAILERTNTQLGRIRGAREIDTRSLGLTEAVVTMNVSRQRDQAALTGRAAEQLAASIVEWCGG